MRRRVLVALLTLLPTAAAAQTIVDGRVWLGATLSARPSADSPWRIAVDSTLRSRDGFEALDAWHVRPAIGRDVTQHLSIWAGYGFFRSLPAAGRSVDEHRVWQQVLWSRPVGHSNISSRSRLEQRDLDGNSRLAWRFRQQLRFVRPFGASRFSMVVWDEVALFLNTTARTRRGLDQNRAFAGVSVALSPALRVETGYQHQFSRSVAGPNRLNHIFSTSLGVTF